MKPRNQPDPADQLDLVVIPATPHPTWLGSCTKTQTERTQRGLHPTGRQLGDESSTCGGCAHLVRRRISRKRFLKCDLDREHWTSGPGSDIRAKWRGCAEHDSDQLRPEINATTLQILADLADFEVVHRISTQSWSATIWLDGARYGLGVTEFELSEDGAIPDSTYHLARAAVHCILDERMPAGLEVDAIRAALRESQ